MNLSKLTKAVGHNDLYINESGEAYHIKKITLSQKTVTDGKYRRVDEHYGAEPFSRIMAKTFLDNPNNLPEVEHIDHNPLNNSLLNLQWITQEANTSKQSFNPRYRYKGVEHDKDRNQYRGYFHVRENGKRKRYRTARYDTKEEAANARLDLIKHTKGHILDRFKLI